MRPPRLPAAVFLAWLAIWAFPAALCAWAEPPQGRPWRAAYVEGGPSHDHQLVFQALARELARQDNSNLWDAPLGADAESNQALWKWLAGRSWPRLDFLPDGYYSAGWDRERRALNKAALLKRLQERRDVDLILALGTWAGQDLATAEHGVPVLVLASNDPVESGVTASAEDSGLDHVAALFDPRRTERQLSIFHDIFRFRRLGLVYEDSPSGRAYANLAEVQKSAARLGFQVVPCTGNVNSTDRGEAVAAQLACHRRLAPLVDAIFLTQNTGVAHERMGELLEPLIQAGLPTFSQLGAAEVRLGVLLSIAQSDYQEIAQAAGRAVEAIIQGQKPRSLDQTYETSFNIAVNLRTAMNIGWDPPWSVLAAVDEIFKHIQKVDLDQ